MGKRFAHEFQRGQVQVHDRQVQLKSKGITAPTMETKHVVARVNMERAKCEHDLGILVSENLSWLEQTAAAVNKANTVLGQLK